MAGARPAQRGARADDVVRRSEGDQDLLELDLLHQMLLHDIRSPLHAARVAISVVRAASSPAMEEAAGLAEAEIQKALQYLGEWSHLLSAKELEPVMSDVEACVRSAWASVDTMPGHSLVLDPLPAWRLDPVQVRRVFQNLFTNSIRSAGGAPVHVRVSRVPEAQHLSVLVQDDGPGIPEGRREGLFRPAPSARRDGHGLGLVICSRVMAAHGGTIAYRPGKGRGSTFVVTFP